MSLDFSARVKLALLLIVSSLLLSNLVLLTTVVTFDFSFIGRDEVTLLEERMAILRKILPAQGVVGYIDDQKGAKEFFMVQYVLAPLTLVNANYPIENQNEIKGIKQWILGNFRECIEVECNRKTEFPVFRIVRKGLVLYRNEQ